MDHSTWTEGNDEVPIYAREPEIARPEQAVGAEDVFVPTPPLRLADSKHGYAEGPLPPEASASGGGDPSQAPGSEEEPHPEGRGVAVPPAAHHAPAERQEFSPFVSMARNESALIVDLFSYCRTHLPTGQIGAFFRSVDGDRLVPTEGFGIEPGDLSGVVAKRGVGLVGVAALSGRPQLRVDLGADLGEPDPTRIFYSAKKLRSALAVPLAAKGSVLGVVGLYSTEAGAFTLADASTVQHACFTAAQLLVSIRALSKMEQEVQEARLVIDMARHLGPRATLEELMSFVMDRAKEMVDGDVASVMLSDPATSELWIGKAEGLSADVVSTTRLAPGCGIAGWVAQNARPLVVKDFPLDGTNGKVKWAVCVPMRDDDRVVGVLNVGSRERDKHVDDAEMKMLLKLAAQAGASIESARALTAMRQLHHDTMRALIGALEAVDPYGKGHSESVARYAAAMATRLGLPVDQVRTIETAGMLHDVGKASLGEGLLRKNRPLTTVEQASVHLHPEMSAELLKDVPMLSAVVPAIAHHHERFDGAGYGRGLAGTDIPLGARILAIADAFDAMTSERPYRPARSASEAMSELERGAGTQFDPEIVAVFREIMRDDL